MPIKTLDQIAEKALRDALAVVAYVNGRPMEIDTRKAILLNYSMSLDPKTGKLVVAAVKAGERLPNV